MKSFLIVSLFMTLISCQSQNSPENVLSSFVKQNFAGKLSKSDLSDMTTGKLKAYIDELSDEELDAYLSLENNKYNKLKILHKACEAEKCFLTYTINYSTTQDDKKTFETDTKKIAEIVLENKLWKISNIEHIKTYHDAKEEIRP
ncbi:MAG: hypothetical protein JNM93_03325 [Bacteriovoracaceae bacterium]|nr:hypothetical protein [Bacteriovoracaceae bacterium]